MIVHNTNRLDLVLEQTAFVPAICSGCGHVHDTPIHSIGTSVVEDLPISGKRVFLHIPKRKSRCIVDDSIRIEELDWLRGRFAKRFADRYETPGNNEDDEKSGTKKSGREALFLGSGNNFICFKSG